MGSHAKQNLENPEYSPPLSSHYRLSYPLPKELFIKDYPASPKNLGQRLRKSRMDAGLLIRELADLLDVAEDTIINWEFRGMRPRGRNLERVEVFIAEHNLNKERNS